MMKHMSPEEIKELMNHAGESKKILEDTVRKILDEEIQKRDLISRSDALAMLNDNE